MEFTDTEVEKVFQELSKWIVEDKSKIVRVNSMQSLADISKKNINIKDRTIILIKEQIKTGIPSLISRGKKILN